MKIEIGIDEVGMGTLAGPVVVAVVVFPAGLRIPGVCDSKKLTFAKIEAVVDAIYKNAIFEDVLTANLSGISNLTQTWIHLVSELARRAHSRFPDEQIVLDGNRLVGLDYVKSIVGADKSHNAVSAASIIAKYVQCCIMEDMHIQYPQYNFNQHRGYATALHKQRIKEFGPCPTHRKMFRPFNKYS